MENVVTEKRSSIFEENIVDVDTHEAKSSDSAENFQKFIYELFENNGVINDLRAYLRGHIVEVLRSAQTGEPPSCQKHFTQRLELPYQALNILIVEYLLSMEFNYSLSVFMSEIPLANMVFAYAKSLMQNSNRESGLRFRNEDVWSILNYLGIKCDSEHASNILKMYKGDKNLPLLVCLMRCVQMYKEPVEIDHESSQESILSSDKSIESVDKARVSHKSHCKHYALCKSCRSKLIRIKEKYKKKKTNLAENMNGFRSNSVPAESFLKNIDVMEKNIIDEMFHQLKSVYESEVEMLKSSEEARVRRSLATHAIELRKKRDEMEERYKTRSAELERNIEQKKRFLWGLARSLRDQHQHMTRAMHDVRAETRRLAAKEDSLKSQLLEAEQILRQRGEDMRNQISNELAILESHLESMKKERNSINKERSELEHIKKLCDKTNIDVNENEDLKSHYDLLKNEFSILRKYLETAKIEPKCVIERGTLTDLADVTSGEDIVLNNNHELERNRSDDRIKSKQVVNDLKKQKNVNFNQSNLDEIYRSRSRSRSRSSGSSDAGDGHSSPLDDQLRILHDDNERLRDFARQQREQIDTLTSGQARLQAELSLRTARPVTAPASFPQHNFIHRVNSSSNNSSHGWRKGAGEELSFLANAQPRIVVPGDNIPFIGIIRESRHSDSRRYLINQWRSLRRRVSPLITRRHTHSSENPATTDANVPINIQDDRNTNESEDIFPMARHENQHRPKSAVTEMKKREKSPKSVILEAKGKLKNFGHNTRHQSPIITREKSPNSVLREAKLRLRKLEIEAEAVEKSYQDFRKRHEHETGKTGQKSKNDNIDECDTRKNRSAYKMDISAKESTSKYYQVPQTSTSELDNYLQEYYKYDIGAKHFKNNNTAFVQMKPIPNAFSIETEKKNYLETPLTEFRKYYNSDKRIESNNDRPRSSDMHMQYIDSINLRPKSPKLRNLMSSEGSQRPISPVLRNVVNSESNCAKSLIPINHEKSMHMQSIDNFSSRPKSPIVRNLENPECIQRTLSPILTIVVNSEIKRTKSPMRKTIIDQEERMNVQHIDNVTSPMIKALENSESKELSISAVIVDNSDNNKAPILKAITAQSENCSLPIAPIIDKDDSKCKNSPSTTQNSDIGAAPTKETISKIEHNKLKELEILEHNIKKIYNLPEKFDLGEEKTSDTVEKVELAENDNESYVITATTAVVTHVQAGESESQEEIKERNLLRIEVENMGEVNDVKITESQTQDLLFYVESSIEDYRISDTDSDRDKMTTQMTIIVSPKRSCAKKQDSNALVSKSDNNKSYDKVENLTGSDLLKDIYQGAPNQISSVQMQLELSKNALDNSLSELEQRHDDYPDDFSADVDNYNSRSEYGNRSPISLAKTSEDENYWDS